MKRAKNPSALVFLGNPGREYENTRHNISWKILIEYTRYHSLNWKEKSKGLYSKFQVHGNDLYLIKPMNFMNRSGEVIVPLLSYFKIEPETMVVVHDQTELTFGQLAIKFGGGNAGHNGLKDITKHLGNSFFYRLEFGVGRPQHGSMSKHVLGNFTQEEEIILPLLIENSAKKLDNICREGLIPSDKKDIFFSS